MRITGIAGKKMLIWEIIVGVITLTINITALILSAFAIDYQLIPEWLGILIIILAFSNLVIVLLLLAKIESMVGYFKCPICGHKRAPSFKEFMLTIHCGYKHYLKCPECQQKSWHKKTLD